MRSARRPRPPARRASAGPAGGPATGLATGSSRHHPGRFGIAGRSRPAVGGRSQVIGSWPFLPRLERDSHQRDSVSDLSDPAERAAYLDRECGDDAELRGRVEALLRANDAAPLPPAGAADVTGTRALDGQPGTEGHGDPTACVGAVLGGKYKLIEEI